ncbi:MAG: isopentenyl phosphate kinase [Nitrososphaerota archaeon]|nr:isopentenyl phosphate kinase [Candidatus Bathyarchaeota archaeon]MDW8023585.1 isopentenyl phosphate kinase [Nitrososphaerota archaeon]
MSQARPSVLKIGGSVITDKNKELGAQMEVISRLADEIRDANSQNLIIIHGGGSFGHPIAQKYAIKEGFREESQIIGFAETHHVMTVLNGLFMDALIWRGIPSVSVAPSSCIVTRNGRICHFEDAPVKYLLKMGFIPVLYGDAVFDTDLGFTILSGDQLASYLAVHFNAENILIGVDVDGLYDADPKTTDKARMYDHLTLEELKKVQGSIGGSSACDVTGGMSSKIAELIPAIEHGISALIFNATKPKNVYKALKGEKVKGTLIEKE